MKKQHIIDVAKIKASKVGEEVIVGLLDMGIIAVNENTEIGFEVINDPVSNRENLLRMAYTTGAKILGEKKVSSDDYDHATALYKDQWKDRKIADYDKEHGRDSRAKEMRADAGEDRKRMYGLTKDKWKHGKYATGEEEGKKSETGNTPDPKDAYKKEDYDNPLVRAAAQYISEKDLSYKERQNLSKGEFALPGKGGGPEGKQGGSYPIPDESHARNALARVSQHGSEAEKKKVRAAVAKKYPGIKIG